MFKHAINSVHLILLILIQAAPLSAKNPGKGAKAGINPKAAADMVFIKAGCFEMGDPFPQKTRLDGDPDEKPLHTVCLSGYYMGKYEVTVGEFREFVEETGYLTEAEKGAGCYIVIGGRNWENRPEMNWRTLKQGEDHPVVCLSWNDVDEYIKWKRKKTGLAYRLPTEAEWEYAARSLGKPYKYSWGNNEPSGNIADESVKKEMGDLFPENTYWKGYDDGYVFTAPVGSFKPNEIGLYDMSGNVWEWTGDYYDVDYYRKSPRDNPKGNKSADSSRVRKGGSWNDDFRHQRISNRSRSYQFRSRFDLGFRLVIDPDGKID